MMAVSDIRSNISSGFSHCFNVVQSITSGSIAQLPWVFSRATTLRYFPCMGAASNAIRNVGNSWLSLSVSAVMVSDFFGIIPYDRNCRVTVDCFLLFVSLLGALKTFKNETRHVVELMTKENLTKTEQFKQTVVSTALACLSAWTLAKVVRDSMNLYQGVQIFNSLTVMQQAGVLKHRAIHLLSIPKETNAVIIDGMSSKWGTVLRDSTPSAFGEFTYEVANTRYYQVDSDVALRDALADAVHAFGENIANLEILGHGLDPAGQESSQYIKLGFEYFFNGQTEQINHINEFLKENAHIFLISCNSAAKTDQHPVSLAAKVASSVSSFFVTGIGHLFNPFFSSQTLHPDHTLSLRSWFPYFIMDQAVTFDPRIAK